MDRLLGEADESGRYTLDAYVRSVADDLEILLNTRRVLRDASAGGVVAFGLPDFSRYTTASSADRDTMIRLVKAAIDEHEPRLSNVGVRLSEERTGAASLKFIIKATLHADPFREDVDFRATYLSTSLRFTLSQGGRGSA